MRLHCSRQISFTVNNHIYGRTYRDFFFLVIVPIKISLHFFYGDLTMRMPIQVRAFVLRSVYLSADSEVSDDFFQCTARTLI